MQQCKILEFDNATSVAEEERIINSYLAKGYQIVGVTVCHNYSRRIYLVK